MVRVFSILLLMFIMPGCMTDTINYGGLFLDSKESIITPDSFYNKELAEYKETQEFIKAKMNFGEANKNFKKKALSHYLEGLKGLYILTAFQEHWRNVDKSIDNLLKEKKLEGWFNLKKSDAIKTPYSNNKKLLMNVEELRKITAKNFNFAYEYGDPRALNRMGEYYLYDIKFPRDRLAKAEELFIKALAFDLPAAYFNLGVMHYKGYAKNNNLELALVCFIKAAQKGYALALHNLGYFYLNGIYFDRNIDKAIEFFKQAADKRSAYSAYLVMTHFVQKHNKEEINLNAKFLSESDSLNYNNLYSHFKFSVSDIVTGNVDKKFDYYNVIKKLKEYENIEYTGDSPRDIYLLLNMYIKGLIVKESIVKASKIFDRLKEKNVKARMLKDPEIMILVFYQFGRYMQSFFSNSKETIMKTFAINQDIFRKYFSKKGEYYKAYFDKSDLFKHPSVLHNYSLNKKYALSKKSRGYSKTSATKNSYIDTREYILVKKNYENDSNKDFREESREKGLDFLSRDNDSEIGLKRLNDAYHEGDIYSAYLIGHYYLLNKKYYKAYDWLNKSLILNVKQAYFDLAVMYYNGYIVKKDTKKAIEYFTKSALKGNADSLYNMGVFYYHGMGVKPDKKEAKKFFNKAALLGSDSAIYVLMKLHINENMPGHIDVNPKLVEKSYDDYDLRSTKLIKKGYLEGEFQYSSYDNNSDDDYNFIENTFKNNSDRINYITAYSMAMIYKNKYISWHPFVDKKTIKKHIFSFFKKVKIDEKYNVNSFFKKNVHLGFKANFQLGLCYKDGYGVKKDLQKMSIIFNRGIKYFDLNLKEEYYK